METWSDKQLKGRNFGEEEEKHLLIFIEVVGFRNSFIVRYAKTDPVSETLYFLVSRVPDDGQCPNTQ
jgi:hypothetical protein